jgi:hypothetical protein
MATTRVQQQFRFRNNDGSESAATWKAATNTALTIKVAADQSLRYRVSVQQTGKTARPLTAYLYYSKNSGAYRALTNLTTDIKIADSAFLTDDAPTTRQISSGSFIAGHVDDVNGQCTATANMPQSSYTEIEWMVRLIAANLSRGDTIDLRCYQTNQAMDAYTVTGRLIVQKDTSLPAVVKALILGGPDVRLRVARRTVIDSVALHMIGQSAELIAPRYLSIATYSGHAMGNDAGLRIERQLTIDAGAVQETGIDEGLIWIALLEAALREIFLQAPITYLIYDRSFFGTIIRASPPTGFDLIGVDAGLNDMRLLEASAHGLDWIGIDAGLLYVLRIKAAQFAFTLAGQSAQLVISASPAIVAELGTFDLAGQSTQLQRQAEISANTYALHWNGHAARLIWSHAAGSGLFESTIFGDDE